ncbi:MAG TPA: phage holin family protein [Candidatus Krumholzibacteria bacterium]
MGRTSPFLVISGRVLVLWTVEVVVLFALTWVVPGLLMPRWETGVLAVALIGVLNALLRPFLLLLTLPFTVLSLGFLTLVINTVVFHIAAVVLPDMDATFGASFVCALVLAVGNSMASTLFAFHEEDSVYRYILRRVSRPFRGPVRPGTPGIIFIEIDGLATTTLDQALRNGYMPALRGLLRSGTHRLSRWDCGLPSQTSSVQAGILFGNNFDIPGFRWYDKATGRMIMSNDPDDVKHIEQRVSRGTGLLREGGVSICNMFTGDADRCVATLSTLNPAEHVRKSSAVYFPYFVYPYNFTRTLMMILAELVIERWQGWQQRFRNDYPRVSRGGSFPLLRAASTVFQRELGTYALMSEMFAGVPAAYITYTGYDVVAHHAGPERSDAMRILRSVDRRIALLLRCALEAPRAYHFVFLSDHGHTPSIPFRQRHGKGIETVVHELIRGEGRVRAPIVRTQGWLHLRTLITEALAYDRLTPRAASRLLRARVRIRAAADDDTGAGDVMVCPSGNLGHIYFTGEPRRLELADIAGGHPGLIEGLVAHPGIGFVMVRSPLHGPVVMGRAGVHYLRDNRVEGDDPLEDYGGVAARRHLLRLDEFPRCGDVVVMGRYDSAANEVETFEELVGAHGGLGGAQSLAFLVAPARWHIPAELIDSPEGIHQVFIRWRESLSQGRDPAARVDVVARDAL